MKNKILLALTILFGLMMVNSGLNKFFNYMPMPELSPEMAAVFIALMTTKWIFPLVAVAEIAGGILIAIPKYRALGAIIILPVMIAFSCIISRMIWQELVLGWFFSFDTLRPQMPDSFERQLQVGK